ncbi:DUF742 domain-containing protein (plasmid) [Streptomyces sp. BI20]|uniref:DUF742 domain-containing protein n=1 Tax=Streptomyces sp. BI20 TaxID=3403460 RepID=UPI003C791B06
MTGPDPHWEDRSPERLYVITGGRSGPTIPERLDLVTLVVAREGPRPEVSPEQAAILRMCRAPLSVAEISAYSGLPVSVVTVLISDMVAENQVMTRPPVAPARLPDRHLLEAVIHGLQKL